MTSFQKIRIPKINIDRYLSQIPIESPRENFSNCLRSHPDVEKIQSKQITRIETIRVRTTESIKINTGETRPFKIDPYKLSYAWLVENSVNLLCDYDCVCHWFFRLSQLLFPYFPNCFSDKKDSISLSGNEISMN
jgi:hypothetical protein